MRASRLLPLVLIVCVVCSSASAQQTASTSSPPATSDPQAIALLQKAVAVLTGGASVTDVTLNGTATVTKSGGLANITGQATESDTVTLVATASGQSQITSVTPFGTKTTIQSISGGTPKLTIVGTNGVAQVIQTATALTPYPAWFYPAMLLASGLSSPYSASYIGHETWAGTPVEHISIWWTGSSVSPKATSTITTRVVEAPGEISLRSRL